MSPRTIRARCRRCGCPRCGTSPTEQPRRARGRCPCAGAPALSLNPPTGFPGGVTSESIFIAKNEVDTGPAHPQVRSTVALRGLPGVGPVGAVTRAAASSQPRRRRPQRPPAPRQCHRRRTRGLSVQRRSVLRNVEPVTSITPTRTKAKEKKQMINQTETTRRPITDRGVYRTTPTQNEAATGIRILSLNPPTGRAQRIWRYGGNAS